LVLQRGFLTKCGRQLESTSDQSEIQCNNVSDEKREKTMIFTSHVLKLSNLQASNELRYQKDADKLADHRRPSHTGHQLEMDQATNDLHQWMEVEE